MAVTKLHGAADTETYITLHMSVFVPRCTFNFVSVAEVVNLSINDHAKELVIRKNYETWALYAEHWPLHNYFTVWESSGV